MGIRYLSHKWHQLVSYTSNRNKGSQCPDYQPSWEKTRNPHLKKRNHHVIRCSCEISWELTFFFYCSTLYFSVNTSYLKHGHRRSEESHRANTETEIFRLIASHLNIEQCFQLKVRVQPLELPVQCLKGG